MHYSGATNGTNVLAISAAVPVSEFFYECLNHSGSGFGGGNFTLVVKPMDTVADTDAAKNDAVLLDRSAKAGPINLPTTMPLIGTTQEILSAYLSSADRVPQSGSSSFSLWHGILHFPAALRGTFTNIQTGGTFTLWNGDTITVTDSHGNTGNFIWTPLSTVQWALVPNSLRDKNGNPPGTTPTIALPAGGSVTATLPSGQSTTITSYQAPSGNPPLPKGSVTVDPDPFGTGGVLVGCENGGVCADIPNR